MCSLFERLGIKGTRIEMGYANTTDKNFPQQVARWTEMFARFQKHNITTMVTLGGGGSGEYMPLGRIRSLLNDKAEGPMQYPGDFAWLPKYDEDFQKMVAVLAGTFGWPKGPVNAVELWNEPWEGISISGWGGDLPRYREIYEKMALGVEDARAQAKVDVLIGGTCSSMNTEDKLFCDGTDKFLKWLDFTSIHYQPMGNVPVLIPQWMERKSPHGPVRAWDTESWVANSEERVSAVIASMRAQGLARTAGVLHDKVRREITADIRTEGGKTKRVTVMQAWSPGAGIAATQALVGQRAFRELMFKNGLPWVFLFDGLAGKDGKADAEDGTVVVVGDLGGVYDRELCKFRSVYGLANVAKVAAAKKALDELPATATKEQRQDAQRIWRAAEVLTGATMTIDDPAGTFRTYDFYGNLLPAGKGKTVVPLNGLGYFVRADGKAGSFAKLLEAVRAARIDGYEPLDMQARDMTAPLAAQPELKLTLTNILNRPVSGKLSVTLGKLTLDAAGQTVAFAAHETKAVVLKVTGGAAEETNTYPLTASFDAGADGTATLNDTMHVNVIAHRTISVDGKLDDWKDVLPQVVVGSPDAGPSLTEKAWLPFVNFPEKAGTGLTVAYLACDDKQFYFAAKITDPTAEEGGVRFATRDDDQYYYPEKSYQVNKDSKDGKRQELVWPEGVRRFSYRKNPDIPVGGDAIQIAFNVLPPEQKGMYPFPPGTMEHFMVYKDTDYEYYLHPVAAQWGGGTEIWRLLAPGVPRKHFYPRQPKAKIDGGPVEGGKLAIVRQGNTRIVECSLPWSEIPHVQAAMQAGKCVKFSFRVTDSVGPSYELAGNRSVSKHNPLSFHEYWAQSWANEVEFGFAKE
jgi:hypothetical protein